MGNFFSDLRSYDVWGCWLFDVMYFDRYFTSFKRFKTCKTVVLDGIRDPKIRISRELFIPCEVWIYVYFGK